jgi:RNA polymerase sigma-70 factor, ECF subfamily
VSPEAADADLLDAHVGGDPDAFAQLVHRHRDRLWAVALRTLGDPEEAADALQEALISAFRNAASFRGDSAVTTWLHRIVVNACLDRIRRRRARPTVSLADRDVPQPRDDHAVTELQLDVRAALARLPEPQRLALVLVDMEDLPVAEAAELLGVPEGTIKSRCARGRMAMAQLLRPAGPGNQADLGSQADLGNQADHGNQGNPGNQGNRPGSRRVGPTAGPATGPISRGGVR